MLGTSLEAPAQKKSEYPIRKILRCHFKKTMKYGLNDFKN